MPNFMPELIRAHKEKFVKTCQSDHQKYGFPITGNTVIDITMALADVLTQCAFDASGGLESCVASGKSGVISSTVGGYFFGEGAQSNVGYQNPELLFDESLVQIIRLLGDI